MNVNWQSLGGSDFLPPELLNPDKTSCFRARSWACAQPAVCMTPKWAREVFQPLISLTRWGIT